MNVWSISRMRSGEACSSCSDRKRLGSIKWGAVIVCLLSEKVFIGLSKNHAVTVLVYDDTLTGIRYTTLLDATKSGHVPGSGVISR